MAKSTAASIRMVEKDSNGKVVNPLIGAWRVLTDSEGIVCTTGWPFKLRGTAKPLYLKIAYGQIAIEKILQDTFAMSQLCWSAPDRCMRLPIDLKLCDEYLRAIASEADDDEAAFDEPDYEGRGVADSAG